MKTTKTFTPIETDRLILRRWKTEDLAPFAALNADPRVMEYFPSTLTTEETANMIKIMEDRFEENGISFCAAELKRTGETVGFIGLNIPGYPLPFQPCVEIGWRLAAKHWGQGLAVEGAKALLDYGFKTLNLEEIVAFTATQNMKSRRVMEKLGMQYDPVGDFDHPKLAEGHPLRRHVLYRIS